MKKMKCHKLKNGDDWAFICIGKDCAYSMSVLRRGDMLYVYHISDLLKYKTIEMGKYFGTLKDAKKQFIGMAKRGELK